MSTPKLTVAIPTCNGANHLAATLDSVLGQRDLSFDLIVSDDCSDDETLALIENRAGGRARVFVNETRLGLGGNWNQCVNLCHTPLIAIIHQDDVLCPGHLSSHVAAFLKNDALGLVCSASTVIDEHGRDVPSTVVDPGGLGPSDRTFPPGSLEVPISAGNLLRCSAVSIRVEAFHDVGDFDASLRYVLDWDFWLRVARRWAVAWLASPTVKVRWHGDSETQRFKTGRADLDETRRMLDALYSRSDPGQVDRDLLRRRIHTKLARAYLNRALDALHAGQVELARECLDESIRLSPGVMKAILSDPRLAIQMASLRLSPRLTKRWFTRS